MRDYKKELQLLCQQKIESLGLCSNAQYADRLKLEFRHIDWQDEHYYLVDLYERKCKFAKNENNMLVVHLLGLADEFDISQPPKFTFIAEFPDIDSDFLPEIQQWLKNVWAPQTFGAEYVCNIGNYATYGIKSALQDMARVYGLSHDEVNTVTTQIEDKDDENKPITWEKALELNKELAAYCEQYPEVYDAAKRLYGRVRGMGKHAGGLIISSMPLADFVPLVVDKQGNPLSAWTEGLHAQDLAPVGLVKVDVLVITNLVQIAKCLKLIRERYGIDRMCNLEAQDDWSDTEKYQNDPDAIALANEAKLKCIFQFDSPGIRDLAKKGGVTSFDDLVAFTSLYRPGPMGSQLHTTYCKRKKGEPYELHPLLKPILEKTYGVMCYQEQIMKIFNVIGGFPLPQCYKIVKAISKKKGEVFQKAKVQFLEQCQQRLDYSEQEANEFFESIAKFSGYAFNLSHATSYSFVSAMLLYLKAHYPLEFFAAILSCEKNADKIKEYRLEAQRFGVPINRIDINKSKVHFEIIDNEIYLGFADIKGVGDEVAEKIVAGQPYSSFVDFMERFGTYADVLKPLIALRVFSDEPMVLYEFAEFYRCKSKSRKDRDKRYITSQQDRLDEIISLVQSEYEKIIDGDWCAQFKDLKKKEFIEKHSAMCLDGMAEDVFTAINQYNKSKANNEKKVALDTVITMDNWNPSGKIDHEMQVLLSHHLSIAENKYYGFPWDYVLTQSPDYKGRTFEEFDIAIAQGDHAIKPVEVQIIEKPRIMKSKKGYKVKVVDGNGRAETVTIWKDDFERFEEEIAWWEPTCEWGNLLQMRLKKPMGDWKDYTFESFPRELRKEMVPKEKSQDGRLNVLRWPESAIVKQDVIDKIKEDFTIID
ncbi:MAG: hypothetical protein M0R80_01735 [Proteobacteria bacterium]|jgi:DNA polymerase III alpha subunit|nr:hypothetical protein [Pseudomonadota bacterium]